MYRIPEDRNETKFIVEITRYLNDIIEELVTENMNENMPLINSLADTNELIINRGNCLIKMQLDQLDLKLERLNNNLER